MANENSELRMSDGVVLGVHLDIGHQSIGWAVTEEGDPLIVRGCGTLLFEKDGCLASARRASRRQRRHTRSTRRRMARIRAMLKHLGVLTEEQLDIPGCAWPWKLAAEALMRDRALTWPELWDVLRWYAHNRGYDNNVSWQRNDSSDNEEDEDAKKTKESLRAAQALMERYGTSSMAATFCAVLGVKPGGDRSSSHLRFKGENASFPRAVVQSELRGILEKQIGKLQGVDADLIRALLGAPNDDPDAWEAVACPDVKLPGRYSGGLLFGQLIPRFDNRIIGACPVSGDKLPMKRSPEFLEYRWAMLLANIRVMRALADEMTPLSADERVLVTKRLREAGFFTKSSLKKAVDEACSPSDTNIDNMLLHPDADKALVLYPALAACGQGDMKKVWDLLSKEAQRRILSRLGRGKTLPMGEIRDMADDTAAFDVVLADKGKKGKKGKKGEQVALDLESREDDEGQEDNGGKKEKDPLKRLVRAKFPTGRAPYSREVMRTAVQQVMEGNDPRSEGGVLASTAGQFVLPEDKIDKKTNNHLVRHRLRMLRRLLGAVVEEYACGNKGLVCQVTIEFNRNVQEMSGKTAKEMAAEMTLLLKSHRQAVEYAAKQLGIAEREVGAGLIRKVRIALDLDWTCPYTGKKYDIRDLQTGAVELEHIIPRSDRQSDSLDSLVITFKEVNKWKSNSNAIDFIQANQGQQVPGMPNLSILSLDRYTSLVDTFRKKRMPHSSRKGERKTPDERCRDNRCRRLLEKSCGKNGKNGGFTPGDLTVSSHLATLAAGVARDFFKDPDFIPHVICIPGRVTKEVRMSHKLLGYIAEVNPDVIGGNNELRTKTEIRDISNLHHAVDAITLGIARTQIPANGAIWGLMAKRNLRPDERARLEKTGSFIFDAAGRAHLPELHPETVESIKACLRECRVATHISSSKDGAVLEQLTWGVVDTQDGRVILRQRTRDAKTGQLSTKLSDESSKSLLGIDPEGPSKLRRINGALVISRNWGLALDPEPEVIPFHKVWHRVGEIIRKNGGKTPRILRNGMIIRVPEGRYKGTWKIFSIKDKKRGIQLNMGCPDVVTVEKAKTRAYENVILNTLLKSGMEICPMSYTGTPISSPDPD